MAEPSTRRNPPTFTQTYARQKLARLDRCDGIKPQRASDELVVCLNDQVELRGNPLRHFPDEIRALRELAAPTWPSVADRIERVLASVPDLCPACLGERWIETDERDNGEMHVGHVPCWMCNDDVEPVPPRMPRR